MGLTIFWQISYVIGRLAMLAWSDDWFLPQSDFKTSLTAQLYFHDVLHIQGAKAISGKRFKLIFIYIASNETNDTSEESP